MYSILISICFVYSKALDYKGKIVFKHHILYEQINNKTNATVISFFL